MQNLPFYLRGIRVNSIPLEGLQAGMVYEIQHDGLSNVFGHGAYGGLNEEGQPRWWVEGYSLREYNERSPPEIDWKKTPICNVIPQRHPFLRLEPVSDFDNYVKKKMPKGVRKFFENFLQSPTFPEPPAEKHACEKCGKTYICKGHLDNHIKSGVCTTPSITRTASEKHACEKCGKTYICKGHLDNHIKSGVCTTPSITRTASVTDSTPRKVFGCPHCAKPLTTQVRLDNHVAVCELKNVGRIPALQSPSPVPLPRYAPTQHPTQFPPLVEEDQNEWARSQVPPCIDSDEEKNSNEEERVEPEHVVKGYGAVKPRKKRTVTGPLHNCKHCGREYKVYGCFVKHEAGCEDAPKRKVPQLEPKPMGKLGSTERTTTEQANMHPSPNIKGAQRKASKPMELPSSTERVVSRFWNPIDAGKGFTWDELESIGDKILDGTTFLRVHYKMRPGVPWATDTESMIVADGALYVRGGEIWVHYPDPEFNMREHLDVTADCCILMVEELKSSFWGV